MLGADVVILALALTEETTGIVNAEVLGAMDAHAWLVNVVEDRSWTPLRW